MEIKGSIFRLIAMTVLAAAFVPPGNAIAQPAPASFSLRDGDVVVFYGDSITAQRKYTRDVESLIYTRYPKLNVRFYDAGNSGDSVRGGSAGSVDERLARDVFPHHPTVVTIMLGMNDGAYSRGDADARAVRYEEGYRHLALQLKQHLPGVRLFFIQPSPYDEFAHTATDARQYNATMVRYGDIDRKLAAEFGAKLIDANAPVVETVRRAQQLSPYLGASMLPDRVHPSVQAAWAIALPIVQAWHFDPIVTTVVLDAKGTLLESTKTVVSGIRTQNAGLEWIQDDESLPVGLDARDGLQQVLFRLTDVASLDHEELHVSGLASRSYDLWIDGAWITSFSREELATGVNLARIYTPMLRTAVDVGASVEERSQNDILRFNIEAHGQGLPDQSCALRALEAWDDLRFKAERKKLKLKPHTYRLVPSGTNPGGGVVDGRP